MAHSVALPRFLLVPALAAWAVQARGESLFSDDFDTDTAANWTLFSGGYSMLGDPPAVTLGNQNDYTIDWSYDYSTQSYFFYSDGDNSVELKVPPAPHSKGTTKGLKITINKDDVNSRNAVNLYPKGKSFSGDFVLSFDVFMNYSDYAGGGVGTTEYAIYGLNFTGTELNWMSSDFSSTFAPPAPGASSSDGIWFMNTGDGGAGRNWRMCFGQGPTKGPIDPALVNPPATEIALYGDRNADGVADNRLVAGDYSTYMKKLFPSPPGEFAGITGKRWNTVEVSQFKGTVTWKMNGEIISQFQNPTPYTAGNIMIGYMDIFESISSPLDETWAIFDNVRVNSIRSVVVTTADNDSPPNDGKTSLLEALKDLQDFDYITFNIPGGAQVIKTPIGGYPLITKSGVVIDGYSQPGSSPNTNDILGGNNAKILITLDSTSDATLPNPVDPALPLVASTRLSAFGDLPNGGSGGYGSSENAILGLVAAENVTIRGLNFIGRQTPGSDEDPSIYCIALVKGSKNTKVQGNSFGLAADGSLKGTSSAVAAFRYREKDEAGNATDTYSEGLTVGTDSDGLNDKGEFNLINGMHIGLALELPRLRVQGNYFNLRADGKTFLNVNEIHDQLTAVERTGDAASVENIENGRVTDNSVIGTDGDGNYDANERNIFNTVYYDEVIQFYSSAHGLKVSGNYFGVGVDGTSVPVAPLDKTPNLLDLPGGNTEVQLGSNRDGVSDDLEGNLVVGITGNTLVVAGKTVPIIARGNNLKGNGFDGFPFANGSDGRNYDEYYVGIVADPTKAVPVVTSYENGFLKGSVGVPSTDYPFVDVDIYLADPNAPEDPNAPGTKLVIPGTYLGTRSEGVPDQDADPNVGGFAFDLSTWNIPSGANLCVVASYQKDEKSSNPGQAVSSPVSNSVPTGGSAPIGAITAVQEGTNLRLTWTGGTPPFQVQGRPVLKSGSWANVGAPVTERTALVPITDLGTSFFQIQGQ